MGRYAFGTVLGHHLGYATKTGGGETKESSSREYNTIRRECCVECDGRIDLHRSGRDSAAYVGRGSQNAIPATSGTHGSSALRGMQGLRKFQCLL
eukprot:3011858-Amphidinium_carterae.1